jgi:proteasome lid subunit RPN8/RPN11
MIPPMATSPIPVLSMYAAALLSFVGAVKLRGEAYQPIHDPLQRALSRGEVSPGIPRLDPEDAIANAAVLRLALNNVGTPGRDESECKLGGRRFSVMLDGRTSRVLFDARQVCQLRKLKQISVAQPGYGEHGLGEVAAYVLGRRDREDEVTVTRIIVPPFRFTGDTVTLPDADLGPLAPGERFVGTFHTHPDDDLEQGLLSETDLHFMRYGHVDFHGKVGYVGAPSPDRDWLFDIVEPRDGEWNVYAHDAKLLDRLRRTCRETDDCPIEELRITGSPFFLFVRHFEDRPRG